MLTIDDPISREIQRHTRGQEAPVGLPEFEAMVILNLTREQPGLAKGRLVARALDQLGSDETRTRALLKYVDMLVGLGYLQVCEFRIYLSPSGSQHLKVVVNRNQVALRALAFGTM